MKAFYNQRRYKYFIKQSARVISKCLMLAFVVLFSLSGCAAGVQSKIASANPQPKISAKSPLTCGEFVYLWMKKLDGNQGYSKTVNQAVNTAKQKGYIPSTVSSATTLTVEQLTYLLTATSQGKAKIVYSHYDWQLSDLDKAGSNFKAYLVATYAKGLLTANNGIINPKDKVYLKGATAVIERLTGTKKRAMPPDYTAPYFEYQGLVEVKRLDPTISLDLKYATKNNFTGVVHYKRILCLLEAETAKRLVRANRYFNKRGYYIKFWDGYRPVSVQWSLYYATPKNLKQYAPAPSKYSQHSKGIAADITLVDKSGKEMAMPTGFDSFSEKAHADYSNLPKLIKANRDYLINGMEQQGFVVNTLEWWHYYLPNKTGLSISKVSLDDFVAKRDKFYQASIQNYYRSKK